MAYIQPRKNKAGEIVSYRIKVSNGYSADGTTQHTQSMTWKPPKAGMSEKQIQKALAKAAADFEQACAGGQVVNCTKLGNFIETWFNVHETALKPATIKKYRDLTPRIVLKLGHLRLDRIGTKDIDAFLVWLANQRNSAPLAKCKVDLKSIIKERGETQKTLAEKAGVSPNCIRTCYSSAGGNTILWSNAEKIANALEKSPSAMFEKIVDETCLSPKTIRCYHGFLSTVFNYAVKVGEIQKNPCENCTLPRMSAPERTILTIEQAQTLLSLLDEYAPLKYRFFLNIAIYGGFRRSEILALRWSDIDFTNNLVHVNRSVSWSKQTGYIYSEPKTATSKRTVKLPDRIMMLLKQQRNEQLSAAFQFGDYWHNDGDLIFTASDGTPMGMASPFTFLKKFCKAYDLPQINVHSLRHLNATLLINSGADVKTVSTLLGHSQTSTTLNIYAHELQSAKAAASAAVAAMLDSRLSDQGKFKAK